MDVQCSIGWISILSGHFNCGCFCKMARNINKLFPSEILNFTGAINFIFYISELYGLIPYSMLHFYRSKVLSSSFRGNIQSFGFLLGYVSAYHFILARTYFDGQTFDSGKTE